MNEITKENWEEEFEKRFIQKDRAGKRYTLSHFMNDLSVAEEVKSFIRHLIEQKNPSMTDPNEKDLLETLDYLIGCTGDVESKDADPELKAGVEAIRHLIENMDKKVSREFVEKWVKLWMQDDTNFLRRELTKMLSDLGHEVEREKKE